MIVGGLEKLKAKLKRIAEQRQVSPNDAVVVGYTQTYAVIVHEDLQMQHQPGKIAKYLEVPAKQHEKAVAEVIAKSFAKSKDLPSAMLIGGLRIQRESQKVVPIDTTALKASAFTCYQRDLDAISQSAFNRSEGVRMAEQKKRMVKGLKKAMRKASSKAKAAVKKQIVRENLSRRRRARWK